MASDHNKADENQLGTSSTVATDKNKDVVARVGDTSNMLKHIENLERQLNEKNDKIKEANARVDKLSQRTREGMQSALNTLMKKWIDSVETKDEKAKKSFEDGMQHLVRNSAEDNGVWQMMVAASALHERQTHDLDQLRLENTELKRKVDGSFASESDRTESLGKRKAEKEPATESEPTDNIWADFASQCRNF
mgnify:CR=1 FL=1